MSEPHKPWAGTPFEDEYQMLCDGIDRERARADRSEAEFSACKALLVAAEAASEEALTREGEMFEQATARMLECNALRARAEEAGRKLEHENALHLAAERAADRLLATAEQRVSEARAALEDSHRQAEDVLVERWDGKVAPEYPRAYGILSGGVQRALAALPVEPARPQVTEITQRAPAARSPATPEEDGG